MSALRELLAHFSIEVDDKALKEGEKGITGLVEKLKHAGEAFATAFALEKFKGFIEGQIQAGAQLKASAERLGTNTDELQAMTLAAEQAGVSADTLTTSLRFLNRNIAEAGKAGNEHAKTFKELGITLKNADGSTKSSTDLMGDFADAVAKIQDPAKQTQVAMQLLGRGGAALLPLLKEGGESFRQARKQMIELGGGMSKEFVEAAHKAEAANVRLNFAMTGLKSTVVTALLPAFERLVEVGTKVIVNMLEVAKHTGAMKAVFAALAVGAALVAPVVTAIAVAAGILYLAFDELFALMSGGESFIGDALGPDKEQFVADLSDAVNVLVDAFVELAGAGDENTTAIGALVTVVVSLAKAMAEVVELISAIVEGFEKIGEVAGDVFGGNFARAGASLSDIGSKGHANRDEYDKKQADEQRNIERAQTAEEHMAGTQRAILARARAKKEQKDYDSGNFYGPPSAVPSEGSLVHAGAVPAYLRRSNYVEVDTAGKHEPGGANGPPTVHQQNNFHTEVHTQPGANPTEVAGAVNSAVATPVQRATQRAYIAGSPP